MILAFSFIRRAGACAVPPDRIPEFGHKMHKRRISRVLLGFLRHSVIPAPGFRPGILLAALCLLPSAHLAAQGAGAFGSHERNTSALIGIFYDLKQNQQRAPMSEGGKHYAATIDDFIVSGFDEALLNRFFRAPLPLYTTQIHTGRLSAEVAPKAFGVENEVKPRGWVVHYKGQIAPPEDGTYRFVGHADDLLVVAINRRVVLNGSLRSTPLKQLNWKSPEGKGAPIAALKNPSYGDWMELSADQPVDVDILIGERPGGIFQAYLFYEKQGETYPKNKAGHLILPLFQVAELPDNSKDYLTDRPVWRCLE